MNNANKTDDPRITVGLLLDTDELPAWLYEAVFELTQMEGVTIGLLVYNEAEGAQPREIDGGATNKASSVFSLLEKVDTLLFSRRLKLNAFAKKNIRPALARVPSLKVRPRVEGRRCAFGAEDIEKIRSQRLDILVKAGFGELTGAVLTAAKYGVWAYYHADPERLRGRPHGFWEVMEGHPVTGAALEILSGAPGAGRLLLSLLDHDLPLFLPRQPQLLPLDLQRFFTPAGAATSGAGRRAVFRRSGQAQL